MTKPNIILLTDDEHRWDFYTGGLIENLRTPAIDRLKRDGVTMTNAVSNCPVCMPTRFTWLTGLYASQSAAGPRNAKDWPRTHPTVAHALQRAGYHTALIGKLHSHCGRTLAKHHLRDLEEHTRERGFDHVFECSGRSFMANEFFEGCRYTDYLKEKGLLDKLIDDIRSREHRKGGTNFHSSAVLKPEDHFDHFVCDEMIRWLDDRPADQPFFLHASFFGPHFPLDPPEPWFSRHKPEDMPIPVGVDAPDEIDFWRKQRASYCGLVEFTDHCVGRLLDALEARGLMDDTIIIFTSDHGDMMGDHGLFFKMKPYDASVRTPTIVRDPFSKRAGGTVLTDMVEAADVPATILEAGCDEHLQEAMPAAPGKSFLGYARGETDAHRDWAYSEIGNLSEGGNAWRMARTPEWKYVYGEKGDMLFNMTDDPFEENNLANDPARAARVCDMRGWLVKRMGSLMIPPESVSCNVPIEFYKGMMDAYQGMLNAKRR